MTESNPQFVLARHPEGALQEADFEWRETSRSEPAEGEILVRSLYLSLDPANRGWINKGGSYRDAVTPGQVMPGFTIGRVVESTFPGLAAGDVVEVELEGVGILRNRVGRER